MAKQSGGMPKIDEDFMKELISQGVPVKKIINRMMHHIPILHHKLPKRNSRRKRCGWRKRQTASARAVRATTGKPTSESGTGRPTALVREPYHAREADAYRDGDRRAQGDGKQLRGKHSAAPLRAVPRRDKHPVRKPLPKACLTMVIYCILTGILVYYIALWLWYRYTDSRTSPGRTDDAPLHETGFRATR